MRAILLSIGTEITTGQCVDTNSAWLSQQLTRRGVTVVQHVTVDDDLGRLSAALAGALRDAPLVIATGGLGPTADDLTREAVARVLGVPLELNTEALEQVEGFFDRWKRPMADVNRVQALIPRGCRVLANRRGTAPGIHGLLRKAPASSELFALPGVPSEMKAMFAEWIEPVVEQAGGGARTLTGRLLCFGMPESTLGQAIVDLMARDRNPSVGTTASGGIINVRIVARGSDEVEARRLVDADLADVRGRLGDVVFGADDETLQQVVVRMLIDRGLTIATAESCTGGLVAKCLTDVPGSSACFVEGFVTYANAAKEKRLHVSTSMVEEMGAVSEEIAAAMAVGCRESAESDMAVSLTGIAGPTGGRPPDKPVGLVYIGLADRGGVEVRRCLFGEHLSREEIRDRGCKTALNFVRLKLLASRTA